MKCLLAIALAVSSAAFGHESIHRSFWSNNAQVFKVAKDGRYESIWSPDGEIDFSFDGERFTFHDKSGKTLGELSESVSAPELMEIGWSADSKSVFINASDGGSSGTWNTQVYELSNSGMHELLVEKLVAQNSALETDCQFKNTSAVTWVNGHRDLLVLEQVPDSSGCSHMGQIAGYVIDVDALKVLDRLNAGQIKARFQSLLGTDGRAAVE